MKLPKYVKDGRMVPGLRSNYLEVLPDPTNPKLPYLIDPPSARENARKYYDKSKSADQLDPRFAYWINIANRIKRVTRNEVGVFVGVHCHWCNTDTFVDPRYLTAQKPAKSCGCYISQASMDSFRKNRSVGRFKGAKNKARSKHITIDPKTSLPVKSPTLRAWEDLRALQHTLPQDPKWRSFGVFLKDVGVSPYPYPCRVAPLHPERRMDLGNAVWKEGEWDDFEVFRFINN